MRQGMVLVGLIVGGVMLGGCVGTRVGAQKEGAAKPPPTAAKTGKGKVLDLVATKNARIFCHTSESEYNGGGCHRLRAADITKDYGDFSIIDFDRSALKAFIEKHKGRKVTGKLVLAIRDIQQGPAKLEVAALDSGSDWNQGTKSQEKAEKGEVCFVAAQYGVKPWTTGEGKAVKNLGDLFYDRRAESIKAVLNSAAVTVSDADKMNSVAIELEDGFLTHLATSENCRGIIVFTRSEGARVYFSSRDKEGKEPRLVVAAD
ncbi:MAG: hypothetical protein ACUVWX_06695 [Kiritimatiellia bacterium]